MNIQAKLLGALFLGLLILGSYYATFRYGKHVDFVEQENIRKDTLLKSTKANDNLKLLLQVERQNAENALNVLLDRKPDRVRLPACSSQPNPASGEPQAIEADRILLGEIESVLSADRQRTRSIVGEAERELIECRVSKNWAAQLK